MKYTKLGNSNLTVSRICMGCMGFGDPGRGQHSWTIDEDRSREIIKRGLELGVNFYDTAIAYQSGTSEQYLGRALRDFSRREDVVTATKFLPRSRAGISPMQAPAITAFTARFRAAGSGKKAKQSGALPSLPTAKQRFASPAERRRLYAQGAIPSRRNE